MNSPKDLSLSVGEPAGQACTVVNHYFAPGPVAAHDSGKACFCGQMAVHLTLAGLAVESPGYRGFIPLEGA